MTGESHVKLIRSQLPKKLLASSKEEIVRYFTRRISGIYSRNIRLKTRERANILKNEAQDARKRRLRLGLSLKPALDPAVRRRLDEIDKKLGFQ